MAAFAADNVVAVRLCPPGLRPFSLADLRANDAHAAPVLLHFIGDILQVYVVAALYVVQAAHAATAQRTAPVQAELGA
ncbi:hypothetical protein D3C79_1035310 [compost metagenome]